MPAPPFAQVQVSIAGAGPVSGGVNAAFTQSVVLTAVSTVGWQSALWEIYDYPPGFSAPAGWSTSPQNVIFFQPPNPTTAPPSFNLPASGQQNWGKFPIRLRINGNPLQFNANGSPNTGFTKQYTDEATVIRIPSPTLALPGVCFNETIQFDALRAAVGDLMQCFRKLDQASTGAGFVDPTGTGFLHNTGGVLDGAARAVNLATSDVTGTLAWAAGGRLQGILHVTSGTSPGLLTPTTQIAMMETATGATSATFPNAASFGGTIPDGFEVLVLDTDGAAATNNVTVNPNGSSIFDPNLQAITSSNVTFATNWAVGWWMWDATRTHWVDRASLGGGGSVSAPGATITSNTTLGPTNQWNLVAANGQTITQNSPLPGVPYRYTHVAGGGFNNTFTGAGQVTLTAGTGGFTIINPENTLAAAASSVVFIRDQVTYTFMLNSTATVFQCIGVS